MVIVEFEVIPCQVSGYKVNLRLYVPDHIVVHIEVDGRTADYFVMIAPYSVQPALEVRIHIVEINVTLYDFRIVAEILDVHISGSWVGPAQVLRSVAVAQRQVFRAAIQYGPRDGVFGVYVAPG